MAYTEIGKYLVIDPEICHGQMTFKGTRIPVATAFAFMAKGYSIDMLRLEWPQLSREAIEEAIRMAGLALLKDYYTPEELERYLVL